MNTETIDIFIHRAGEKPQIAKIQPNDTLADALQRAGIALDEQMQLFVSHGDTEEADADTHEDALDAVPPGTTAAEAGIRHHSHVHCHRCRRIEVSVNFQGQTQTRKFAPNARIARVRRWAQRVFRLTGPSAGDFTLQVCGSDRGTRPNQDLAEFVDPGTCSACFDLTKELTPQGGG